MLNIKDHKTGYLLDPWDFLGPKRKKLLDASWAGLFREEILPLLPVNQLATAFSVNHGRPSKELYSAIGVVLLQQFFDLSDEETISQVAFNLQWHYALDITEESDASTYFSAKTLWTTRQLLIEQGLEQSLFDEIVAQLAQSFDVNLDKQRLDSVHIQSNMKKRGRIGLFSKTLHKFLTNLKRQAPELFGELPSELTENYLAKQK